MSGDVQRYHFKQYSGQADSPYYVFLTGSHSFLYDSTENRSVGAGSNISLTGSNVANYVTKSFYVFLSGSGGFIVYYSFDNVRYYQAKSGSAVSGSLTWFTFNDAVPFVSGSLFNYDTAPVTGSMWLIVRSN